MPGTGSLTKPSRWPAEDNYCSAAREVSCSICIFKRSISAWNNALQVRVYGDTGVLTGRTAQKGQFKGKDISGQTRLFKNA
jgi:hypothetical protein